jgi:hypothetical protein
MPATITFGTSATIGRIFRATSGGTVFSADVKGGAHDLFDNSPAVNDAIYFGFVNSVSISKINFDITTAIVGTDVVLAWEVFRNTVDGVADGSADAWSDVFTQTDDTAGFTNTGANSFKLGVPKGVRWTTVNSVANYYWVRCRLVSFTSITEGGATNTVTASTATLVVSGTTDSSPGNLEEIYQYLLTNAPWINVTKIGGLYKPTYDFSEICLQLLWSPVQVQNEGLILGNANSQRAGQQYFHGLNNLSYLKMGVRVGDDFGYNGGWLQLNGGNNSYAFGFSTNTEIYGSHIKGIAGYPSLLGKWVYNKIDLVNFSMVTGTNDCVFRNNQVNNNLTLASTQFPLDFTKNKYALHTHFMYLYNSNFVATEFDYEWVTDGQILYEFNTIGANCKYRFINPARPLPAVQSATPRLFYRAVSAVNSNWNKVWYYDDSAGTYTDYTTECNNNTANNMPVHGDVNDYYYFGVNTKPNFMNFIMNVVASASNDYEYEFESYITGAWRKHTIVKDGSDNFQKNGLVFFFGPDNNSTSTDLAINGYTSRWIRMKIVTKGTGSPMVTRIYNGLEQSLSNWEFNEEYSLNCFVTDEDGDRIENADVTLDLDGDEVYTGQTDETGNIEEQILKYRSAFLDPLNETGTVTFGRIADTYMNSYDITISKAGYETYKSKVNMSERRDLVITLKKSYDIMPVLGKGFATRADPTNSTKDRDVLIMP